MKKASAVVYPLIFLLITGCSSGYKTAIVKTRNIISNNTVHLPLIVDLVIDDARVTASYTGRTDLGLEYAKTQAVSMVLKKCNADVLLEPQFMIVSTGNSISIEVSGHPAHYKNFRVPNATTPAPVTVSKVIAPPAEENILQEPVKSAESAPAQAKKQHEKIQPAKETITPQPVPVETEVEVPKEEKTTAPYAAPIAKDEEKSVAPAEAKPAVTDEEPVEPEQTAAPAPDKAVKTETAKADGVPAGPDIVYHKVLAGETAEGICKQFGITIENFNNWNYLDDGLKAGDNVVVKFVSAKKNTEVKTPAQPTVAPTPVQPAPAPTPAQSIPVATPKPAANTGSGIKYHVVVAGETLYHLSVVNHVTVQQLKDWNKLTGNAVEVGQNLIVGK